MILSTKIEVKISNQGQYYADLGYENAKQGSMLSVDVKHLPTNSNKLVKVGCDKCGGIFERQFQLLNRQQLHLCKDCSYIERVNKADYTKISESNKKELEKNTLVGTIVSLIFKHTKERLCE